MYGMLSWKGVGSSTKACPTPGNLWMTMKTCRALRRRTLLSWLF